MPQYIVITPDGKRYGPTDFPTLSEWAEDGRVGPGMIVEDLLSGQTMVASAVPGLSFESQEGPHVNYPRTEPSGANGDKLPTTAMVLGFLGMVAWCIPLIGIPVGVGALLFGIRSLKSEERSKALIGIVLGSFCVLLSLVNAIAGAMMYALMGR